MTDTYSSTRFQLQGSCSGSEKLIKINHSKFQSQGHTFHVFSKNCFREFQDIFQHPTKDLTNAYFHTQKKHQTVRVRVYRVYLSGAARISVRGEHIRGSDSQGVRGRSSQMPENFRNFSKNFLRKQQNVHYFRIFCRKI